MPKLEWLETFELGVAEIDDDHKEMLALMRRIETAGNAGDFEASDELLDALLVEARAHFEREERLLEKAGYEHIAAHREYHAGLVERAAAVMQVCKSLRSPESFRGCCDEMFGFLIDDIVAGDLRFKSFLDQKGLTRRP